MRATEGDGRRGLPGGERHVGPAPRRARAPAPPAPSPRSAWRRFAEVALLPFALSRAALLAAAALGQQFDPSWTYFDPLSPVRGWTRARELALDVWGRYDTDWYLNLAHHGYQPTHDLAREQSNLAFFPLYSLLVRAAHALLPSAWQGERGRYVVAVVLANVLAIAALWAVYLAVRAFWEDEGVARRTVLYLLAFPAGFFLSCAYSESLFLLLTAAAFLAGARGRWGWCAVAGALAGLTRPTGVLLAPALAVLYLDRAGWDLRRVRADALGVLGAPLGFAAHAARLALVTGDPGAVFRPQAAWGRALTAPWTTLLHPRWWHRTMGPVELACVLLFLALAVALLAQRRLALGVFALLSLAPILLSGTLMSATRFVGVVFPAFALLAAWGRRELVDRAVLLVFGSVQAALFIAWARYYWVA